MTNHHLGDFVFFTDSIMICSFNKTRNNEHLMSFKNPNMFFSDFP